MNTTIIREEILILGQMGWRDLFDKEWACKFQRFFALISASINEIFSDTSVFDLDPGCL